MRGARMKNGCLFQLHHTGIKTTVALSQARTVALFQLHHTGIKTWQSYRGGLWQSYFNCTIQELKQREFGYSSCLLGFQLHHTGIKTFGSANVRCVIEYFNCTIQELKRVGVLLYMFWSKLGDWALVGSSLVGVLLYMFWSCNFNCTIQELKPKRN